MSDLPLLPEAREELLAAVDYYETASPGLGEEFITDVESAFPGLPPSHGTVAPRREEPAAWSLADFPSMSSISKTTMMFS